MWQLLGVFISGVAMGGVGYLVRKISRKRLGTWTIPTFAAVGMFGFLASYDYTWYETKLGLLPEDVVIIETKRDTSFFRMWSYIKAPVSSFKFYDGNAIQDPGYRGERVMLFFIYEYVKNPLETYEVYAAIMACRSQGMGVTRLRNETIESFKGGQGSIADRLETLRKAGEWKNVSDFEQIALNDPLYQRICN